ncbi:transcription-repair-coupling factor [Buchnera aphidicola (Aphis glycines)]|uniref:Transcription-repair-coupling factor n=1 Tax=Buchnera aphidicola (Aphis glycines) TaxID=1265350 RepID=A0A0M4H4J2_9GAMM|nr:transcription-repair coupling factor [Buchnera aphidicola]ALD15243.1 transcription-repair-coupling factor [Buchnera aphidicola (Aphis glycines)]
MKIISTSIANKNFLNYHHQQLPSFFKKNRDINNINKIFSFLHDFSGKTIFFITKQECLIEVLKILNLKNIYPKYIKNIYDVNHKNTFFYVIGNLHQSFIDIKKNFLFISTKEIIKINNNINIKPIKNKFLYQLKIHDLIIHIQHGIGRYQGLTTIKTASYESEYLVILYAEENKLYVPISSLHLISPYSGNSEKNIVLHKLGSNKWDKEKNKISKNLYDHAVILLNIYANRLSKKGFSFQKNEEQYNLFCQDCLFQVTSDQKNAIKSVLNDMNKSIPMDRIICGDVGFGKTEIAMRAAFICISNKKQVVVLVPTTLLAEQHFNNFSKRFANWSINIDILSRFRSIKEKKKILENISIGKINILIGTHKILFENIEWYNPGLLIIDEEHRFGVIHKEIIKKIYSHIDILTLTATPIPRTLNMAMHGIKDLSIISNPPKERKKIQTFINEYNPILIKKAISQEISRGGQVYYIYNKIQGIDNIATKLLNLIPNAKIKIVHGKMNHIDLKNIMNEFYQNCFNVLVCTTVIESGIDIPKANTIVIENADHFGLSQLHQLRGRIGRSNNQGYAFLFVNNFKKVTLDAQKRLEAIAMTNNFGGGFNLSNRDLEIRGIGELLGKEQSGHIDCIGIDLYMKFLHKTIKIYKNGEKISLENLIKKSYIELYIPALLPKNYIFDLNQRLFFYEKIEHAKSEKEIKIISLELLNQFGKLPIYAKNLILIAKIKLLTKEIGISHIKSNKNIGIIKFNKKNSINMQYLLSIFHKEPDLWKMINSTKLKFFHSFQSDTMRINWIINLLKHLKKSNS